MSDLSDLDQEAVEKVANDIEEKLHNLYQDINPKYKNKYRSLLFNLKDTRNQVGQAEKKLMRLCFSSLSPPPPSLPLFFHRDCFARCYVVK